MTNTSKITDIALRLEELKRTAYSFHCLEEWVNKNIELFDVSFTDNDEVSVSIYFPAWRTVKWDEAKGSGHYSLCITIEVEQNPEHAKGIHSFFAQPDASYAKTVVEQKWAMSFTEWPLLAIEYIADKLEEYRKSDVLLLDETRILSHVIPAVLPGIDLEKLTTLVDSGLMPTESDGSITADIIGPYLLSARNNGTLRIAALPEDMSPKFI